MRQTSKDGSPGGGRRRLGTAGAGLLVLVLAGALVAATEPDAQGPSGPLSGVGGPLASTGATQERSLAAPAVEDAAGSGKRAQDERASPTVAPSGGRTVDPAGPRIVRSAELSVRVGKGKFTGAFDRAASIAASHGGFVVASSTVTDEGDGRQGSSRPKAGDLTIRVAADRFDAARKALSELGTVERASLRGEDVGGQLVDYEARLRSLQAQEESLRTLLGRAGGVGEVLQVQNALFDVRQQIEQLQAQRDQLSQAAALSTLSVSLFERGAGVVPQPEPTTGLAHSLERAWDGAIEVLGGMIVVVGVLSPLALLGLLVWIASRSRRRGAGDSTPDAAPAPATP